MPIENPIENALKKLGNLKYIVTNIVISMGYSGFWEWVNKFFIPISVVSFLSMLFFYLFTELPRWWLIVLLLIYVGFVFFYPLYNYFSKILDLKSHLFYFITYVTSLSTLQISRNIIFKRVSQAKKFGYLSEIAEKIIYFSKGWNLGFSKAVRKVKNFIPYKPLADFFERLATISDFGEDVETFFMQEEESVINQLVADYNKTYEYIRMIQELFISFIVTFSFITALFMILPILTGSPLEGFVKYLAIFIFTADLFLVIVVRFLIPKDDLLHELPITSDFAKKVNYSFIISFPLCLVNLIMLWILFSNRIPFLVIVALGITPLFLPAFLADSLEKKIIEKEKAFPAFIRTFGSAIEAKGGGVIAAMEGLLTEDFGPLQELFEKLYVRLKTGNDKYACWLYFGGESDSNLIHNFSQIFAETVYLGGNAEKISEVISKNMQKILGLRQTKLQLVSSLRGALYGALVGFISAGFIGVEVSARLANIFSLPTAVLQETGAEMFGNLLPEIPQIDTSTLLIYVSIMVLIHAFFSAYLLKILDGGHKFAMFFDLVLMVWIGGVLSWFIPVILSRLLPGITATAASIFMY
ncbi:MAG: type II secretion system F family protein [Candidatus Woesearchaeota archaeon]